MRQFFLIVVLSLSSIWAHAQDSGQQTAAYLSAQQPAEEQMQQPADVLPMPPQPPSANAQGQRRRAPVSERYKYDPGATGNEGDVQTTKESSLEKGLKSINKDNVDYGGLLAVWRIAAVKETIENIYFWSLLLFGGGIFIESAYIAWLLHERDRLYHTAGGIIAQLWNSNVHARNKALDAIAAHNDMVARYDALTVAPVGGQTRELVQPRIAAEAPEAADATAVAANVQTPQGSFRPAVPALETPFSGDIPAELFKPKPTSFANEDQANTPEMADNESLPLSVKVARGTWERRDTPSGPEAISEDSEEADAAAQPANSPSKSTDTSSSGASDDLAALQVALQKAIDEAATKDAIIARQNAQISTKDQQILAKDNKIATQRDALIEYQNRDKTGGSAADGAAK